MTNWAGAVETFGKGLFAVGMKVAQREDDEIAFMRQKALQELGIQAQKDLQAQNQEFLKGQATASQEHAKEMFGMETAARAGEQQAGFAHAEAMAEDAKKWDAQRDATMRSFQLKLKESETLDDVIRSTNAQLGDIGKSIDSWEQELMSARSEGADDATIASYQRRIDALYAQQEQVRGAGQAAVSRLTGGKPVQPGPTKEAAAEKAAGKPATSMTPPQKGPPPGGYTGRTGAAAPATQPQGSTLFDSILGPQPDTAEINRRIASGVGSWAGRTLADPNNPTGNINRDIYTRLFGE
jgi:hypothetical protein